MTRPVLPNQSARRLFLDRHLLLNPETGPARGEDLAGLLSDLGFVQVDSVNTLARAHDLILWSRRGRYRPAALQHLVARHRAAFEHWTHDAAIIPIQFFPMWRLKFARDEARMRQRWPNWHGDGWDAETDRILQHVADHGPVSSLEVRDEAAKPSSGWWDWHPSKTALEYLWRSGRLSICHRRGFRKFYDLTERVIPEPFLRERPEDAEVIDWAMTAALDRLGFASSGELAAFFEIATRDEARDWCASALSEGRIIEADVQMANGTTRRSFTTEAMLDSVASLPRPSSRIRILSPFDPALRDRARAHRLFGFHFRIEIFVPEARREYGYYVFPVMQGDRLIGRLDARRAGTVLQIAAFWPEPGIAMTAARQRALIAELERLRHLAGTSELAFASDWLRTPLPRA